MSDMQASIHVGKNTGGKGRLKIEANNFSKRAGNSTEFATVKFVTPEGEVTLFMDSLKDISELGTAIIDAADKEIESVELILPNHNEDEDDPSHDVHNHTTPYPDFVGE